MAQIAKEISADDAARRYEKSGAKDPSGMKDAQSVAEAGKTIAFEIGDGGELVATMSKDGETLWINAAAGSGGVFEKGFKLFDQIAIQSGCNSVSFQTARAGIVKKARQAGYEVAGFILKKKVS